MPCRPQGRRTPRPSDERRLSRSAPRLVAAVALALGVLAWSGAAASATTVDFGPITHQGVKSAGPAPTNLKPPLQLGLIANQQAIAAAAKSGSDPTSSSYGKYPSLSTLASTYGASSSRRNAVIGAFKPYGVTASADVTHLRVSATMSIVKAQKLFGTPWDLYPTGVKNQYNALPVNTPKLGSGLSGNVDTIAGLALQVTEQPGGAASVTKAAARAVVDGGTPTRTGAMDPGCAPNTYPGSVVSPAGLFPNQIDTAYGIAALQAAGLKGQ